MRGQRRKVRVLRARIHVVDQQAHPHAAIRRLEQLVGEELAGEIGVPDVGLHVETALRHARALHAHDESLGAVDQQPECRLARMTGFRRLESAVERRGACGRRCKFHRQITTRLQLRAGAQRQGKCEQ